MNNNQFMPNMQTPQQAFAHVQNPFQSLNFNSFNTSNGMSQEIQTSQGQNQLQQSMLNQPLMQTNFQQNNPFLLNEISNISNVPGNISYLLVPKSFNNQIGFPAQNQNSFSRVPVIDRTSQSNGINFGETYFTDFTDDYLFSENESIANSYRSSILSNINFVDAFDFDDTKI